MTTPTQGDHAQTEDSLVSAIEAAKKLGYSNGYQAGMRRKDKMRPLEHQQSERASFRRQAFLAVLPSLVLASGLMHEGEPIVSLATRVRLAAELADEATKYF